MSSIINNSNANSALINTINASSSKMNPDIYSTKTINPASATVYQKTDSNSGSLGNGKTLSFQLLKYGICQQVLLTYAKDIVNGTDAYDFLEVIDRIELLSSSKVVDTLTNKDILAQLSNLDYSQFRTLNESVVGARPKAAGPGTIFFTLPLVFGFMKQVNTNLNLQFNENMSIRVKFGPNSNLGNSTPAASLNAVTECYLNVRYKNYNEADYSEILSQNYNEPELSQMITGFYDESTSQAVLASGVNTNGVKGTSVELKNTDCVNSFYVMVRQESDGLTPKEALAIDRVVMSASGQTIFDLHRQEFNYSKLCSNGFSLDGSNGSSCENVVKIQTGLYEGGPHGGPQSNTMSLRELNNPIITVFFSVVSLGTPAERKYTVDVVEDAVKIVSTVSSSGRVAVALTN